MTPEDRAAALVTRWKWTFLTKDDAASVEAAFAAAMREAVDAEGGALRAEGERLARIVVSQQEALKALETKLDRQAVEHIKRGDTNARLNKENARLTRQLAAARSEAEARVDAETEACAAALDERAFLWRGVGTAGWATADALDGELTDLARRLRQRAASRAKPAP